jgi:hypothetical protein
MIDKGTGNNSKMDAIILKLADLCPKLRELAHWEFGNYNQHIIISRDGKEVKWKIQASSTTYVDEPVDHACILIFCFQPRI